MNKTYNQNSPILPTHFTTHKPQTAPIRIGIIDKNLRPQVPAAVPEVIQILTVFDCRNSFWEPVNIIANFLGALSQN